MVLEALVNNMVKIDCTRKVKFYGFFYNNSDFFYMHQAINRKHMRAIMFNDFGKKANRNIYRISNSAIKFIESVQKKTPITFSGYIKM